MSEIFDRGSGKSVQERVAAILVKKLLKDFADELGINGIKKSARAPTLSDQVIIDD
jgi:hypothetical protein